MHRRPVQAWVLLHKGLEMLEGPHTVYHLPAHTCGAARCCTVSGTPHTVSISCIVGLHGPMMSRPMAEAGVQHAQMC